MHRAREEFLRRLARQVVDDGFGERARLQDRQLEGGVAGGHPVPHEPAADPPRILEEDLGDGLIGLGDEHERVGGHRQGDRHEHDGDEPPAIGDPPQQAHVTDIGR